MKLTPDQCAKIRYNIKHKGKGLYDQAKELGIDYMELKDQMNKAYSKCSNNVEWKKLREIASKRDKTFIKNEGDEKAEPEIQDEKIKIDVLENELVEYKQEFDLVTQEIEDLNTIIVCSEKNLKKIYNAIKKVKKDLEEKEKNFLEKEEELRRIRENLDEKINEKNILVCSIDSTIQKIAELEKTYIVVSGFKGQIPKRGKFVSVSEINGIECEIQKVPEEYRLPRKTEDIMMYEKTVEYCYAAEVVDLVAYFVIEGREYELLNSDARIEEMIKKYI